MIILILYFYIYEININFKCVENLNNMEEYIEEGKNYLNLVLF